MSRDVGPGLRLSGLPADAKRATDAGPVDLFEELKQAERKRKGNGNKGRGTVNEMKSSS